MEDGLNIEGSGIEIYAKSTKGGLVEYIVKKYILSQLFEIAVTEKIEADIKKEISENLKYDRLIVSVTLIPESNLQFAIIIDEVRVDMSIVSHPLKFIEKDL